MAGLHASRLSLVRVASVRGCSHCYYSGRSSKQANPPADRSWLKPTLRPALKTFLQFASRDSITWERRRSSHKPVVAQPQPDELAAADRRTRCDHGLPRLGRPYRRDDLRLRSALLPSRIVLPNCLSSKDCLAREAKRVMRFQLSRFAWRSLSWPWMPFRKAHEAAESPR